MSITVNNLQIERFLSTMPSLNFIFMFKAILENLDFLINDKNNNHKKTGSLFKTLYLIRITLKTNRLTPGCLNSIIVIREP